MESLLIINNEEKVVSASIINFLEQHYQITVVTNHEKALKIINKKFYDLFLVIATEIDENLIEIFNEIRIDRSDLLPVIICLPDVNDQSQAKAFQQRALYLIEYPIEISQLEKELTGVSQILVVANDKKITLSTRKYDKDYRVKQIIYFERSRPRYLRVLYMENEEILEEEIFYKYAIEQFINTYGLKRHFVQLHQSYLVNPRFIKKIDKVDLEVILITGETIPLGATYFKKNIKGVADCD